MGTIQQGKRRDPARLCGWIVTENKRTAIVRTPRATTNTASLVGSVHMEIRPVIANGSHHPLDTEALIRCFPSASNGNDSLACRVPCSNSFTVIPAAAPGAGATSQHDSSNGSRVLPVILSVRRIPARSARQRSWRMEACRPSICPAGQRLCRGILHFVQDDSERIGWRKIVRANRSPAMLGMT